MIVHGAKSRAEMSASADYFKGPVRMWPVIEAPAPSRVRSVVIEFAAGSRTAWHTHPLGQTLYVLSGKGLAQSWGGEIVAINEGETVWFAPGEKHWHGASPDQAMTHLAIQELHDGRTVDWLEHVSDEQYSPLTTG